MGIIAKIFGDYNEKYLKKLQPLAEKINSLEAKFEGFSIEKIKAKTAEFKERLKRGESLDDILPEAFALAREASKRTLKQRHFDVQLIGGIVLHQGKISQMLTGEGKTLTATLPLYLNALEGKGCHLVTVNDYLARRDAVWMGQIYHLLGLSAGCLNHEQSFLYDPFYKKPDEEKEKARDELGSFRVIEDFLRPVSRKEAYLADITYGTNNEFGFDYLRDNMVYDLNAASQRDFNYAIIDEVDSILIDEARTPLIISAPARETEEVYHRFALIAEKLKKDTDYSIDEKQRAMEWTPEGEDKTAKILERDPWMDGDFRTIHKLENAIKAKEFYLLDREYVIREGEIVIVDEFTGRLMPGRRWSGGIHQSVEAKEHASGHPGVTVKTESVTLATITFQNLFRMYKKLAGMTGTALTSSEEFDRVYKLEVVMVPPNKPMIRKDLPDRFYKSEHGKFLALVQEIKERHEIGQPILVGTRSIERNEFLGKLLDREGVPHQILNAKNHEAEGQIIAQTGKLGAVTIATNMAGRGVDIILGGNPPLRDEAQKVREVKGLHVIGTERHEARRIDDQLRGRTGRQGDPGSSQFFVSLEDELMRIFGGDKIKSMMEFLKIPEDQPIEAKLVSGAIESAQAKIEGMNFDLRKHLLEYDEVLNKHREVIYKKRKEILERAKGSDWRPYLLEIMKKGGFSEKDLEQKEKELGSDRMPEICKLLSLRILDLLWIDHLENMEYLKDAVRLRAYGQQDPLVEYKHEGHKMFRNLLDTLQSSIANSFMKVSVEARREESRGMEPHPELSRSRGQRYERVGRNDPCPCGAKHPDGRPIKYKKCGMLNTDEHQKLMTKKYG